MNPRVKGALLWGVVGLLTFLVLLQGYEIVQDIRVELPVKVGATVVVGVLSTVVTYVASGHVETTPPADGRARSDGQAPPDDPAQTDEAGPTDELKSTDDGQPADGSASTDGAGRDDPRS